MEEKAFSGQQLTREEYVEYLGSLSTKMTTFGISAEAQATLTAEYNKRAAELNALVDQLPPDKQTSFWATYPTLKSQLDARKGTALSPVAQAIVDALRPLITTTFQELHDSMIGPLEDINNLIGAAIGSTMDSVLNISTKTVHPGSPLEPTGALPMFAEIAVAELATGILIQGTNLLHPFKAVFGEQFQAMVYKFLGFNELSSAFWGSIGYELLDQPLRLWGRATFRARVPDHRLADEMYWHGQLNDAEWTKLHTYEGWPDETISKHGRSQWREPTPRELGMITDAVGLPVDTIEEVLRHRGTEPELAKLLATAIAKRPLTNELSQLRTQLIDSTVAGEMTEGELESSLQAIGVTDGEISLIRQIVAIRTSRAAAAQAAKDLKAFQAESVKASTAAYERDLMDEGQYLEELLAAGVEQLKASQTVYLEQVKKIPRPKRT